MKLLVLVHGLLVQVQVLAEALHTSARQPAFLALSTMSIWYAVLGVTPSDQ